MSKMLCRCGAIISDSLYPCSTEGWLIPEVNQEERDCIFEKDVSNFFTAITENRKHDWIRSYFGLDYPTNLSDASIISDILSSIELSLKLSICECISCGQLYIQKAIGENTYIPYAPQEPGYKAILKKLHHEPA